MAFEVHWRAPLQPKGFLKIIEFFLALITLSLVAGFSVNVSSYIECSETPINYSIAIKASYPFRDFKRTVINTTSAGNGINITNVGFGDSGVPRAAEYLVAWGSLTLFYCVIAVLVYMLVTANEQLEKAFDFLVVTDIVFHVVWIICWFIACVDWAVAFPRLKRTLNQHLEILPLADCIRDPDVPFEKDTDSAIYVQAQIAVVFGFLIQFLWAVNIWWLIIDTSWYINWRARGPRLTY